MDRALDLQLLTSALGDHARLPSPEELQRLLSEAEVSLFTHQADVEPQLLDTGWYLQSIATARRDLDLYGTERQRQAHQVSGHIFDLTPPKWGTERVGSVAVHVRRSNCVYGWWVDTKRCCTRPPPYDCS